MKNTFTTFASSAKDLSRNPLGIIALFILLVYGFACLLLGYSGASFQTVERLPIIWFIVVFPIIVLAVFFQLVAKHHQNLYAPSDYKDEENFLRGKQEQSPQPTNPEEIERLSKLGDGLAVVDEKVQLIKNDLAIRNLKISTDTETVLIRNLAFAQVEGWFERTYRLIFGSQIKLLRSLNATDSENTMESLAGYYGAIKNKHPEFYKDYNLREYLGFLSESGLIKKTDETYEITTLGSDFLSLLSIAKYTDEKAY